MFLKKFSKQIIIKDQDRIELMFDLNEVFFNRNFTICKIHCEFLKLCTFPKQLLDELVDFLILCLEILRKTNVVQIFKKMLSGSA